MAKELEEARKKKGFSQDEVAQRLGTKAPIGGSYERDKAKLSIEAAAKLANLLYMSLDYLVGNSEQKIDKKTLGRIQEINKLKNTDKILVYAFLDAFIT